MSAWACIGEISPEKGLSVSSLACPSGDNTYWGVRGDQTARAIVRVFAGGDIRCVAEVNCSTELMDVSADRCLVGGTVDIMDGNVLVTEEGHLHCGVEDGSSSRDAEVSNVVSGVDNGMADRRAVVDAGMADAPSLTVTGGITATEDPSSIGGCSPSTTPNQ